MRRLIYFSFLIMASSLFSSCTTTEEIRTARFGGGLAKQYDIPYKEAFNLALHACQVHDFFVEHQSLEEKVIVASNGISIFSYGERIGIYFDEVTPNETMINVSTTPKIKTHLFAPEWQQDIHSAIYNRLEQLRNQ